MAKFYDTCSLLFHMKEIFNQEEIFYLSSVSINELENIKTSANKDEETKYNARKLLHLLEEHPEKYRVMLFLNSYLEQISDFDLPISNDTKIIATAYHLNRNLLKDDTVIFMTRDLACKEIARTIGLQVEMLKDDRNIEYKGYIEWEPEAEELASFYSNVLPKNINIHNLLINQYLLIKNSQEIVDKYKWTIDGYIKIPFYQAESRMYGKVVPYNQDPYQQIAFDSLFTNQITMIRGSAGTGKSYLSFGYMFHLLEKGKISKIIIFCNTVATKGSAKLGYYPGDREEKLLDSQIGNLLISKFGGDRGAVERLIDSGELLLLPMSDIRGFDTSGMNAAVYISEAQNLDIELMKLALQRIGEDSICILDGDSDAQVDLSLYAGANNGMRRVSEIFKGHDCYGEVTLKNIHRSKIAEIAQQM